MTLPTRRYDLRCDTEADTLRWGRRIGEACHEPAVLALTGDLGSGKTCLVKGLAQGLGVPDTVIVTSPTFALIHEYPGRLPLVHVDLYRLESPDEFEDIGLYEVLERPAVVAVEWADRLGEDLPGRRLDIRMAFHGDLRRIELRAYGLDHCNLLKRVEFSRK